MRNLLAANRAIVCFDEDLSYRLLANHHDLETYLDQHRSTTHVGFKIPRWTEQLDQNVLLDLQTDPDYPSKPVSQFYSSDPLIFMLRDVRGVVTSMMTYNTAGGLWIDVAGRPILAAKIRNQQFLERYRSELAYIIRSNDPRIAAGALYWKYKTESLLRYQRNNLPVLVVRYEELCEHPLTVMRRVIDFLELDWEGAKSVETPPYRESVGRFKTILTEAQIVDIREIAGELSTALGYVI